MTESLEDYLEMIGLLINESGAARVSDIALRMSVSKPSVHNALHELTDRGFINHEPYGAIELTQAGKSVSKKIFERHMLLKSFLMNVLKVSDSAAERDACLLEHDLSEETLEAVKKFMANNNNLKPNGVNLA